MLKTKLNNIYKLIKEDNKINNYDESIDFIAVQIWQRINPMDRLEIMNQRKKVFKTDSANFKACIKILKSYLEV